MISTQENVQEYTGIERDLSSLYCENAAKQNFSRSLATGHLKTSPNLAHVYYQTGHTVYYRCKLNQQQELLCIDKSETEFKSNQLQVGHTGEGAWWQCIGIITSSVHNFGRC